MLAKTRSLIDQATRLAASHESIQTSLRARDSTLLTRSRACIAESKRLLAAVETLTAAIKPNRAEVRTRPDRNSAMLSVRVFQEGLDFNWTLKARSNEVLGRGRAETERQARIDALQAGMTYIDRAKGRSSPGDDTSLH